MLGISNCFISAPYKLLNSSSELVFSEMKLDHAVASAEWKSRPSRSCVSVRTRRSFHSSWTLRLTSADGKGFFWLVDVRHWSQNLKFLLCALQRGLRGFNLLFHFLTKYDGSSSSSSIQESFEDQVILDRVNLGNA
jgi:hypothetical protein